MNRNKAQSLAEYAVLIGIVIAALVGMHTYVKRGLQARYKGVVDVVGESSGVKQYEPYYADTTQTVRQEQSTVYVNKPKGELERRVYSSVAREDAVITQGVDVEADNDWK